MEYMMLLTICNIVATSSFDDMLNIVEALCAVGNVGLLIYFTNREWTYSKQREKINEQEAVKISRLERQKLWYDKIVIERIITYLLEYFDNVDKSFENQKVQSNEEKREFIEKLKVTNRRYKRLIIPCLEMFSHELAQKTNRMLQDYFDILVDKIDKNKDPYDYVFERKVSDKKGEILKKIYDYDFNHNL